MLSFLYPGSRRQGNSGVITQVIDPEKEREADRFALSLLNNAGYDPHSILDLAIHLQADNAHLGDARRIRILEALLLNVPRVRRNDSTSFQYIQRVLKAEMNKTNP